MLALTMMTTETTLCADCKELAVTITASDGPPYETGYQLTCAADKDGSPEESLSYHWFGTNGGEPFYSSSSTVTLLGGEFCLICQATADVEFSKPGDPSNCSVSTFVCDTTTGT